MCRLLHHQRHRHPSGINFCPKIKLMNPWRETEKMAKRIKRSELTKSMSKPAEDS